MKRQYQPCTPAALYARVSSDRQDVDLSVSAQLRALKDYAKANGYSVAREYVDEAESGRVADRPQFREMIEEGSQPKAPFEVILVWKFSRFTRKREHAVAFKSMLRRKGVRVVSITEHADDSPTGKLMEAIIESVDEFYSENLAQEVVRGMREAASRGFFLGSKAPFGYIRVKVSDGAKERPTLKVPTVQKPLPFPELEEERDRAERVKQETPVLVILGNPPYNGFAGMAVDEERGLSEAYRKTKQVRRPEGQGLNDLYVRFFRMAERRIAEKTGQGVVCFISNYSWLDGLSFTGMRERYLEAFDVIRIDSLNGDKYRTGKTTPDGKPDPSIFSTPEDPIGIQVGTAITTLVRKTDHAPTETVGVRHLWGQAKHEELTATAGALPDTLYDSIEPVLELGLPFAQMTVADSWRHWPALPDLFPTSFPGVKTSRDSFLIDIDLTRLKARVTDYFNSESTSRPSPDEASFIRYAYRPFDTRWLYWEADGGLLDRPRPDYKPHVFEGNLWLEARQREAREDFSRGTLCRHLSDNFGNGLSTFFPAWLRDAGLGMDGEAQRHPNLSNAAQLYLTRLGLGVEFLFHHVLAVLHDPAYREANAGALRIG